MPRVERWRQARCSEPRLAGLFEPELGPNTASAAIWPSLRATSYLRRFFVRPFEVPTSLVVSKFDQLGGYGSQNRENLQIPRDCIASACSTVRLAGVLLSPTHRMTGPLGFLNLRPHT